MRGAIEQILDAVRIVPVVEIERVADAVPLATALIDGGLSVIEVTLRTEAALDAIEAICRDVPSCTVGAGSIRDMGMARAARAHGAAFGVSPGTTLDLLNGLDKTDWPFLPGAATVSEVMNLMQHGYLAQKLFPASVLGGPQYLQAISGPLPDVRFCPTGGVRAENAIEYLGLRNVFAIGGTWIADRATIASGDWQTITRRATAALASTQDT